MRYLRESRNTYTLTEVNGVKLLEGPTGSGREAGSRITSSIRRSVSRRACARLAYAVAELVEPSILLLDEVHEALDHEYRAVLEPQAHQILDSGGIVIAAGHDHPMLSRLSRRAIWMEEGSIRADGAFDEVQPAYLEAVEAAASRD